MKRAVHRGTGVLAGVAGAGYNVRHGHPFSADACVIACQRRPGEYALSTADATAIAVVAGFVKKVVSPFAGDSLQTGNGFPVYHEAASDTGTQDHSDDYFGFVQEGFSCAKPAFGHGKAIGIVGHPDGESHDGFKDRKSVAEGKSGFVRVDVEG